MFPGRRGAGKIFHNEVKMSGLVPQICVLFGPSAAGGAYIPAFCDIVIMRDGNSLDVPRLTSDGGDGDRREGHARRDGRRADATPARPAAATRSSRPTRRASTSRSATSATSRPTGRASRPPRRRPTRSPTRRSAISFRRTRTSPSTSRHCWTASSTPTRSWRSTRAGRRSSSSATRASTAASSASSPTSPSRRAACCSSTRPTRPRASSRPAMPSMSRCSSWPTSRGS